MVLFLRNRINQTIVDVEVYKNENDEIDISVNIPIETYSKFLTENLEDDLKIISDFSMLQELRGWYWERYRATENENPTQEEVVERLRGILQSVAKEYQLNYVED